MGVVGDRLRGCHRRLHGTVGRRATGGDRADDRGHDDECDGGTCDVDHAADLHDGSGNDHYRRDNDDGRHDDRSVRGRYAHPVSPGFASRQRRRRRLGMQPGKQALPDGAWFGFVVARDGSAVEFDLACLYFGDIAYEKGAEAGEEVANDYFLSNVNPSLRSITIAGDVPVFEIDATQPDVFLTVPFADWPIDPNLYVACPDTFCGVWLYVNDGTVTEIVEQYFP